MQRWSREAGSWVDDMGVLRIDVDAHANRSLAALARSLLFVIPAKAGTRRLWFFNVSKSLGPRFRGAAGTFYFRSSAPSDRTRAGWGKRGSGRFGPGGRRLFQT